MTTTEDNIQHWTERAEQCLATAAKIERAHRRDPHARKTAKTYRLAATNWRKAAERTTSDDPISRDMADDNARDGARFETLAHQQRHDLDGTPIPSAPTAYPQTQDEPAEHMKSADVRKNMRDVLDRVRSGGEVVIENYTKPIARIVPEDDAVVVLRTPSATQAERLRRLVADHGALGIPLPNNTTPWRVVDEEGQPVNPHAIPSVQVRLSPAPANEIEPRELDIDPTTITLLDGREEWDPILDIVWSRLTVGTAPDGTPVVVLEDRISEHGERDENAPLAVDVVWAYDSIEDARRDRDEQIERDYLPRDVRERIRDVRA
ncbi:hypothetical protein GCM10022254_10190 [Actinomadura meridiana]|uniref:Uncharacterized protein n=1 Tax=Actinomadura meridiana TaxID=559626 RepID=A0ABP8BU22_9ACTN